MTLQTFAPPVGPSPGTKTKRQLKILEAEFGDGYSQPTPDGINHMRKTVSLSWAALTESQMRAIDQFFATHGGTSPFYYQPAGYAAPITWTCKSWDTTIAGGVWSISAELVQAFVVS